MAALLASGTPSVEGLSGSEATVRSAGIGALVGADMDPVIRDQLEMLGVGQRDHVAAQLRAEMVEGADLVITASCSHRTVVARMAPSAVRRIFTLRELAALASLLGTDAFDDCGSSVAERLRHLTEMAPTARGLRLERGPDFDDVPDVARMTKQRAARMLARIQHPVEPEPADEVRRRDGVASLAVAPTRGSRASWRRCTGA